MTEHLRKTLYSAERVTVPGGVPRLLPDALREAAQGAGTPGGVLCGTTRASYADIDRLSDRLGAALIEGGLRPGDRVLSVLPNSIEFVIACFAVWKTGAILVPEDPAIRPANLKRVLRDADPATLILDIGVAEQVETMRNALRDPRAILVKGHTFALPDLEDLRVKSLDAVLQGEEREAAAWPGGSRPDDVVSISYTSGSTGTPKGVMHTHESWLASAEFTRKYTGLTQDDAIVIPLPLQHGLVFRQTLAAVLANAAILIAGDIYEGLKVMREQRPTGLVLVPAACHIMLDHFGSVLREAGGFLRYVEIGSAAMVPERLQQLRDLLPTTLIHLPYGLTEARVGYLAPGSNGRHNRIGAVSPGLELHIVDSLGRPLARGETGEIVLRGRGLMKGYWGRPAAEHEALMREGFATGDMGRLDGGGHIELLGRLDDILKVGGRKVSPLEVQAALNQHPAVAESAVIGLADPQGIFENRLHAFVVLRDEHQPVTTAELLDHCRRHLEPHKLPAWIHFRSSLPKSPVGKVLRCALKPDDAPVSPLLPPSKGEPHVCADQP